MRRIGRFGDAGVASAFVDVLLVWAIRAESRESDDGWAIWVMDDAQVDGARELLELYEKDPKDPRFSGSAKKARAQRGVEAKLDEAYRGRVKQARTSLYGAGGGGWVTKFLVGVSVALYAAQWVGADPSGFHFLYISEYYPPPVLPEVAAGQIWRLWTPMFLHAGLLHLGFNMYWTWNLGLGVEHWKGGAKMAWIVIWTGLFAHLGQYFWAGPNFVGMSGVGFGLVGYLWAKGRLDPADRLALPDETFRLFVIWGLICVTGLIGPVANAAHGLGMLSGLGLAWLETRVLPRLKR